MNYKFYDTTALIREKSKDENSYIIVSSLTAEALKDNKKAMSLVDEVYPYTKSMFRPFIRRGVCDSLYANLVAAFDYDYRQHPDETIFVTADARVRDMAHCFFGEDSIIYIK